MNTCMDMAQEVRKGLYMNVYITMGCKVSEQPRDNNLLSKLISKTILGH